MLGSVVTSSVVLELGPVMTSFVLIGRVGARITAELGTMAVSEQIDALYSLGRDPVSFLAAPRLLAGIIIPIISLHMGLTTHGGAEGVGRNTTTSVVFMIITVLVLDALFPPLFLN